MFLKTWDFDDPLTNGSAIFKEIKTRTCTKSDFNDVDGSNDESNFYATDTNSEKPLDLYYHTLKCIDDDEEVLTQGNYDTN